MGPIRRGDISRGMRDTGAFRGTPVIVAMAVAGEEPSHQGDEREDPEKSCERFLHERRNLWLCRMGVNRSLTSQQVTRILSPR